MSDDGGGSAFARAYWLFAFAIVALKAAGVIQAPWLAVTAPFWAPAVAVAALIAAGIVAGGRGRRDR